MQRRERGWWRDWIGHVVTRVMPNLQRSSTNLNSPLNLSSRIFTNYGFNEETVQNFYLIIFLSQVSVLPSRREMTAFYLNEYTYRRV